jgi:hypothetical protein
MMYTVEMASCGMIYLLSFLKTGTGIQAILRFCLRNVRGCNVGITEGGGGDFLTTPLRWTQVP